MSAPAKPKYRTTNPKQYKRALNARGSLLVWLDKDMRRHSSASSKQGRSPKYSEAATQFGLAIEGPFNLPLGQVQVAAMRMLGDAGCTNDPRE